MKGWANEFHGRGRRLGGAALWASAAMFVVGAHAGGVALLLRHSPELPAADSPAPALMLELAPMSEAVNTDSSNITDQMQNSEEVLSDEVPPEPPEPEPEVVEETPPPPEPEVVEDEPPPLPDPEPEIAEEIPDEIETPVEEAAVVIPHRRPMQRPEIREPAPEKRVVEKPRREREHRRERKEAPSQASTAAAAQVQQSNRNAAAQTAAGAGAKVAPAKWRSRLMAHLERRKRYPAESRAKRETGVAHVTFVIDAAGNVLSSRLAKSSGYPALDRAVVEMVQRASPVPAPPPGVNLTITAPVRFDLR
ncbi:energy transducer TonB family protein [Paenirhodobacter populi]|uniref:Energy transducer TonB n=1 Tax=Paenirhodobacter populi TaxID=2306993 RepID=A0A443IW13_9RHOB|nr:energy transducer TonB [Sinirhodobacter populi]RWR12329.1 energy transducer TonB [Sinirhodobacter populi]